MPDRQNIETQTADAPEKNHTTDPPLPSSRRAAAIEAAYILEAVRK